MDSIERMRRINDLTRELKQHGFAESSFEAIQQANQIYGNEAVDDHVKSGMIAKSQHERMVKDENMEDGTGMTFTERKLSKLSNDMEALTGKMNEIIQAINDLDARMTDLKVKQDKLALVKQESFRPEPVRSEQRVESRVEPRVDAKVEVIVEETVSRPEVKVEPKVEAPHAPHEHADEYAMNQRTGNFQSQDVSIDKMFYFGNKK
jgi:hypothetical protein